MSELFDDPGDLGFFDIQEDESVEEPLDNPFYEPAPGEEDYYE